MVASRGASAQWKIKPQQNRTGAAAVPYSDGQDLSPVGSPSRRSGMRPAPPPPVDAAGYDPGRAHWTAGVEKLVGGHVFQINVSNGVGTTIGQAARGGSKHDTILGFNITRKFWR